MRRSRTVSGSTGKAFDTKTPRAASDGKDAKLDYDSDKAAAGAVMGPNTIGTNPAVRTSKWKGTGQEARR